VRARVERALLAAGATDRSLLVAASGGLDSTVLAHLLAELREPLGLDLVLAHVNHGLRGRASEADAEAVERLAQKLGVPFASARVDPKALRTGTPSRSRPTMQEAARTLRRAALEHMRVERGCEHVVTAHHADDQAETVLMRLLRGCGPDGIGGIGESGEAGVVLRPLLGVSRAEIECYAEGGHLDWREDTSNSDPRYTRNRIRAELLPALRDFNPQLLRAITDLAEAQRRDTEWLQTLVEQEAEGLVTRETKGVLRIAAHGWHERPEALARRLARWLLVEAGAGRDVTRAHLLRVVDFLRHGCAGTAIELPGGLRLERDRDSFVLVRSTHT
jgi:tRNA(Ile)-lysidine synthase